MAVIMVEEDGTVRKFTRQQLEDWSNQVANYLLSQGIKKDDTIALFMENRPEFIGCWLGITKIGAKCAMINTSIKEKGLTHCIKVSNAKGVIFGKELEEQLAAIVSDLGAVKLWHQGPETKSSISSSKSLDAEIVGVSKVAPPASLREGINTSSIFGYIYTSGTTGLPKAANIPHSKLYGFGGGVSTAFSVDPSDIVYTCLPLFHSAGGGLGAGMMFIRGCTMVLRKKFSASKFFEDCTNHQVTVVQYIGELARYLLATPPSKFDRAHKVRIAIGNGLRPEIWLDFQRRFNIPEIGEFYGATESNGALFNHCKSDDAVGAVARAGYLVKKITGYKLCKFDVEKEELVRSKDGFCIEVGDGEPGELLMPIKANDPTTSFAGYSDPKATEKKIARNVFVKGDAYFTTGDLLSCDSKGFYRFVDRIGDTFRWKGENCSTTEVAEVVSVFPGVEEANVYGVLIPNNRDGRAPMAAITLKGRSEEVDLKAMAKHFKKNLPDYAVPLFLRFTPKIDITATFKHQKVELRNEGMDIAKVKDPMYFLDGKNGEYVKLTPDVYGKITQPFSKF
jgi:acyl-CoA synthetase (AMP-forming)/AMP-acid ligase II